MATHRAPGPAGWPGIGVLPAVMRDTLGFFTTTAERHGDIARFRAGRETCHLISQPDAIGQVYQADTDRYYKGEYYQLLSAALGDGLVTRNGDSWRRQRRLMQPALQKNRIDTWLDIIEAQTHALMSTWETPMTDGRPVEMAGEMLNLVQAILVRILFGRDIDYAVTSTMAEAVKDINTHLMRQIIQQPLFGGLLNRLPLPGNRRFHHAVRCVKDTVLNLLKQPTPQGADDALLPVFRAARDRETGSGMDPTQLQDELVNLFLAGHETTAQALAWTFYFLALHPDDAEQVRAESAQVLTDDDGTADQYGKLVYTRQVIEESMRLMPPIFMVSRTPMVDEPLGGFVMPKDSLVILSPYVMHRHPAYWDAPERFDPSRFAPDRSGARPRYAYFPFGGGPRLCLGIHLAMLEMVVIVARVLKNFQLTLAPGARGVPEPALILRPKYGIRLNARRC